MSVLRSFFAPAAGARATVRPAAAATAFLLAWAGAGAGTPTAARAQDAGLDAEAQPRPAGAADDVTAATTDPVTFVSHNLKNWLPMDRRVGGESVENAPKPEEEKAALIAMLVPLDPDVLGVCEIGGPDDLADLQGRLREAGVDLPHSTWADSADKARRLALLSRFPVVATDHQTDLTYPSGEGNLPFQRGILDATVQVNPEYRLRFLGLHLKSKREVPEGDQAAMRRHEAHLTRKHADAILAADPSTNLVIYGDFNDTRNEAPVRALQGPFGTDNYLRDIQVADSDGYRWTYYWRYADQYSRFDFVLVSRALYPEVVQDASHIATSADWFTASDHRPVVVEITPVDRDTP